MMGWIKNILKNKENKKVICPNCGSDRIKTIVYGLLKFKTREDKEEFFKEHVSGGCLISDNDPKYYCDNCGNKF